MLSPLQQLNAKIKDIMVGCLNLMLVQSRIKGFFMRALLNIGAKNNFLSNRVANELGLKVRESDLIVALKNGIKVVASCGGRKKPQSKSLREIPSTLFWETSKVRDLKGFQQRFCKDVYFLHFLRII